MFELQQLFELVPNYDALSDLRNECRKFVEVTEVPGKALALTQGIDVSEVCYSYQQSKNQPWALDCVSLSVPAGKTTVLLGPSGAGKTTLVDLFLGLYRPRSGKILVDGVVLDDSRLYSWRANCGYVPQETQLLSDSLRVNLCWGIPPVADEFIWTCLEQVELVEVVKRLELGLETQIGDRGVCLSGGERQRLALARSLLSKPRFLALDEALNSVSPEQELRILSNIRSAYPLLTVIIVSHRKLPDSIADVSYYLEKGKVLNSKIASAEQTDVTPSISVLSEK